MGSPLITVGAPLRISLAGGGSDIPEYWQQPGKTGRVVSFAIDKYVWVTLSTRFENEVLISYRSSEVVKDIGSIQHGLVRQALQQFELPQTNVEVHLIASLPGRGTGLGSSSALAVALVKACESWNIIHRGYGFRSYGKDLALKAWGMERVCAVSKPGLQDHAIAALGGIRYFEFAEHEPVQTEVLATPEEFHPLITRLLLFQVNSRISACPGKRIIEDMAKRVNNIYPQLKKVAKQAQQMQAHVRLKEWPKVGELLREGWEDKKLFSPMVSTCEIDQLYADALKAGAVGGKICGAGGGGFMLLYCEAHHQSKIRALMQKAGCRELRFGVAADANSDIHT